MKKIFLLTICFLATCVSQGECSSESAPNAPVFPRNRLARRPSIPGIDVSKIADSIKNEKNKHSTIDYEVACGVASFAKMFGCVYDPRCDRVVIDISYSALPAALRKGIPELRENIAADIKDWRKFIEIAKRENRTRDAERYEKCLGKEEKSIVELDEFEKLLVSIDDPANGDNIMRLVKEVLFNTEQLTGDIALTQGVFNSLLDRLWENDTGKKRLKSLFLLQKYENLKGNDRRHIIQILPIAPDDERNNSRACGEMVYFKYLPDESEIVNASMLMHELCHVYHYKVSSFADCGDLSFLNANSYITRSDPKLSSMLFPWPDEKEEISLNQEIINNIRKFKEIHRLNNDTPLDEMLKEKTLDQKIRKFLGIPERGHRWRNSEEMLVIAGIAPLDLRVEDEIYNFIIQDEENENSFHRRTTAGNKTYPHVYHTTAIMLGASSEREIVECIRSAVNELYKDRPEFSDEQIKASFRGVIDMIIRLYNLKNNWEIPNVIPPRSAERIKMGEEAIRMLENIHGDAERGEGVYEKKIISYKNESEDERTWKQLHGGD